VANSESRLFHLELKQQLATFFSGRLGHRLSGIGSGLVGRVARHFGFSGGSEANTSPETQENESKSIDSANKVHDYQWLIQRSKTIMLLGCDADGDFCLVLKA
jgi:hypothetical protein